MSDENKNKNNQDENQNRQECNKIWWKNVVLWETRHFSQNQRFWKKQPNPTYRLGYVYKIE